MNISVYNNYSNFEVTNHYLCVICNALNKAGHNATIVKDFIGISKNDYVMVSAVMDFIKLYKKGFRNLFLWQQGIIAEESYMRNHSKLRYMILSAIDKFAIKKAKFIFLVSNAQKDYYEKKYNLSIDRYYIMPCYNDKLNPAAFENPEKYERNVFSYVGSLAVWQCFEETVRLYKRIEDVVNNSELRVFTKSKEEAKRILTCYRVKHFTIDCLPPEKLSEALNEVKYGFVLRNDDPVNNVATPTKFSSYLSAGVIPITTKAVNDFSNKVKGSEYACILDSIDDVDTIINHMAINIDKTMIRDYYHEIFSTYYSDEYHIEQIAKKLKV